MFFRVVQPSRDAFGFQVVLADGRVALSSVPFADRSAALRAIHVVIACLREGVEASLEVDGDQYRCSIRGLDGAVLATGASLASPAEVDAQLADLLHWVATVERFRVEEPLQASPSAVGYDLEPRSRPRAAGLELLEPARARLFSARIHDERGEPLLYTPGFPTLFARDEHVEALLAALPDPRRYDRRDDEGRHYAVVHTKNGRELARSRWFADPAELEAAVAWLTSLVPDELLAHARREGGAAGFEGYRGAGGQHFFRLNDERGEALFSSHGYASAKARDNGIRSLLKAATDASCYRVTPDGEAFTICALNGRQLVHSREFASFEELEQAIAWVRRDVLRLGKACGIRLWDSMIIELPHDADDTSILGAYTTTGEERVDQPLRSLRVDGADDSREATLPIVEPTSTSLVIEAPLAEPAPAPEPPEAEPPATPDSSPALAVDAPTSATDITDASAGAATTDLAPDVAASDTATIAEPGPPDASAAVEPAPPPLAEVPASAAAEPTGSIELATPEQADITSTASPVDVAATPEQADLTSTASPVDVAATPEQADLTSTASPVDVAATREPTAPARPEADAPSLRESATLSAAEPASPTTAPAAPQHEPAAAVAPSEPPPSATAPAAPQHEPAAAVAPLEPPPSAAAAPESVAPPTSSPASSSRETPRPGPTPATADAVASEPARPTAPAKLVTIAMPRRATLPGVGLDAPKFSAPGQQRPADPIAEPSAPLRITAPERSQGHAVLRPPERSQPHTRPPNSIVPRPPERSQPHAKPRAPAPATAPAPEPPQRPSAATPAATPEPARLSPERPLAPLPQPEPPAPTPSLDAPPEAPASPSIVRTKKRRPRLTTAERAALGGARSGEIVDSAASSSSANHDLDAPRPSVSGSSIVLHPRPTRDDAGARETSAPSDMSLGSGARAPREARPSPAAPRPLPVLLPPGLDASPPAGPPSPPTPPRVTAPAPKADERNAGLRLLGGTVLVLAVVAALIFASRDRGKPGRPDGDVPRNTPMPEAKRTPEPAPAPAPELPRTPDPEPTPEPPPIVEEPPPQPQLALTGCPTDGADDPAIGLAISPAAPVAGKPLRLLAATFADEQPISLQLLADDETPITEDVDLHTRAGLPASALATWTPPAAGDFRILITAGATRVCLPLRVDDRRRRSGARPGPTAVWPVERAWTPGEEALFSAWVRELFAAPDDPDTSAVRLDRRLADPARNLLHGALGLGEDRSSGVRLRPDDVDLPYALRAYWAWKRRLPFAFRKCTDPRSGQPQRCDEPRSNLSAGRRVAARDGELDRARRFFQRTLPASVSAGNARTAHDAADSDLYPVQIDRRALRPGTLYVDPRGQVLVVVELALPHAGTPGALHVVGGRSDGAIARRRFWEGSVVWHPDPQLGGTGFKRFRPVESSDGGVYEWSDEAITESADHADLWTGQAELDARAFHDRVAGLIDPPPWDPAVVQREAAAALLELVQERVVAVDRAAARAARSRRPIDMPRGLALFDATGAWEQFATPSADLRLLGALDVVRALPDRVRDQPGLFELAGDAATVADALDAGLDAALREHRFTYRRSDGSEWPLTLADLAARSAELERAYNPNDCPERRWGAPEGSDEAATCTARAPAEQQERMEQNRDWFRVRRSAARRPG